MSEILDLYPSRESEKFNILKRIDPVVYGEKKVGKFSLSIENLNSYRENGFLLIEDYFKEEIEKLQIEFTMLKNSEELKTKDEIITEPNSDEIRSIFSPQKFSKIFDKLSKSSKILDIVMQILDSEVYIHQSRINIKPAFKGKSFPWHSDFETWHIEDGLPRLRCLTCAIFLTDNSEFNGPLYVIPNSQNDYISCGGVTPKNNYKQSLKNQMYGSPDSESLNYLIKKSKLVGAYGKAGSVLFFDGNIMHGSPDNISATPRTNLFFVYNSVKNTPKKPFSNLAPRPDFLANRNYNGLKTV